MDPLSLISLLSSISTGVKVLGAVADGVSNLVSGEGEGTGQSFASELLGTITSVAKPLIQSSTGTLLANGVSSLVNKEQQAGISQETVQALNNILSGKVDADDVNVLAESNVSSDGDIAFDSESVKLDDPFGIKAAQANGSPMAPVAAPMIIPADSTAVNPVSTDNKTPAIISSVAAQTGAYNTNDIDKLSPTSIDGLDANIGVTTDAEGNVVTPEVPNKTISQSESLNVKLEKPIDKSKAANVAKQTDENAIKKLIENTDKSANVLENKSSNTSSLVANAEKLTDKTSSVTNQPAQAAFFAADMNQDRIGDLARAVRSRTDLSDKLAAIDTYKVASVSKKDNVIDVRLDPASLGKVQIKLDFTDGKTNVMVIADRSDTLDILKNDTKEIQKILSDNGIKAESNSLSFNLRGNNQQGADGQNFFHGKPLAFRVEEAIQKIAANDHIDLSGYGNYGANAGNGLLNIIV